MFKKLVIVDFEEFDNFEEKYWHYKLYNVKNMDNLYAKFRENIILPNRKYIDPLNEINIYKKLLKRIKKQNEEKYKKIHKGTPFFWIGLSSFFLKKYDDSIFYMDAALAEDKKNHPSNVWPDSGAGMFFKLNTDYFRMYTDFPDIVHLKDLLNNELNRFNSMQQNPRLTINEFNISFIDKIIKYERNTAIITTLYSFIFEKNNIMEMLELRGEKGTIEPMILHLMKGATILETLMKKLYPSEGNTLGNIISSHAIQSKYNYAADSCRANSLEEIFGYLNRNNNDSIRTSFYITCKIRNTFSHYLLWSDLFTTETYNKLYEKIINAIFYVIQEEYI